MDDTPDLLRSAAVLQVSDVKRSETFYTQRLGFRSHGTWGDPPSFCIVQRGHVTIMLDRSEREGSLPINQYWATYVYVTDVDALHAEFKAEGVEILRGPEEMPYGCKDFDVRDPDGRTIAFGQDLDPANGPGLDAGG